MTKDKHAADNQALPDVAPSGSTAAAARARRAARSPEYAREWNEQQAAREIAWLLVRYRMEHQLTQEELARRIGTSYSQISRLESGRHLPSVATLGKIADALHLRLSISFEPRPDGELLPTD